MVKGISRRVVVVDSPDPKLFEQAIFIVRNDAFSKDGVTPEQLVNEACRLARCYTATLSGRRTFRWQDYTPWIYTGMGAICVGILWLAAAFL